MTALKYALIVCLTCLCSYMQCFQINTLNFSIAVIYARKMFVKSATAFQSYVFHRDKIGKQSRKKWRYDNLPNDTLPNDTLRNDTLPNDNLCNDTLRSDTLRNDTLRNNTLRNDTLCNDTLRNDTLRNDTLRNGTLRNDTMRNENQLLYRDTV